MLYQCFHVDRYQQYKYRMENSTQNKQNNKEYQIDFVDTKNEN